MIVRKCRGVQHLFVSFRVLASLRCGFWDFSFFLFHAICCSPRLSSHCGDIGSFLSIRTGKSFGAFRPRPLINDKGKLVRYKHHPVEPVPSPHGSSEEKPTPQQVSTAYPYGVREERVEGKETV